MSVHPVPEALDDASTTAAFDLPRPLSSYINGVLNIRFESGVVVARSTTQADARAFLRKQKDEGSDDVTWQTLSWFMWADEQVVYSAFDADRDQHWQVTPRERQLLADGGHPDGVVASLCDLWRSETRGVEPRYSVRAVAALHRIACDGIDRAKWDRVARRFEGKQGAGLVAAILDDTVGDDHNPADDDDEDASEHETHSTDPASDSARNGDGDLQDPRPGRGDQAGSRESAGSEQDAEVPEGTPNPEEPDPGPQ